MEENHSLDQLDPLIALILKGNYDPEVYELARNKNIEISDLKMEVSLLKKAIDDLRKVYIE